MRRGLVMCHGCFDWLHWGHLRHLEAARALGDQLYVSVTADRHIAKGPGRPIFDEDQRVVMLKALSCVTHAFVCETEEAFSSISRFLPEAFCKGADYRDERDPRTQREKRLVESYGGHMEYTGAPLLHTTELLERFHGIRGLSRAS